MNDIVDTTNDIIIYKNRLEVKIMSIAISIVYIPLFSYIIINDLITNNEHFLNNLLVISILGFVAYLPIIIINRYKIIFDYNNQIIIYRSYFSRKKQYKFEDINIIYKKTKGTVLAFDYIFNYKNKKIFKLNNFDFEGNTKESTIYLKKLFKGIEKQIFDLEMKLKSENIDVVVYNYSLPDILFIININNYETSINFEYDKTANDFLIEVEGVSIIEEGYQRHVEAKLLETSRCKIDLLESTCKEIISKYIIS